MLEVSSSPLMLRSSNAVLVSICLEHFHSLVSCTLLILYGKKGIKCLVVQCFETTRPLGLKLEVHRLFLCLMCCDHGIFQILVPLWHLSNVLTIIRICFTPGEPFVDGKVVPYEEKYHADWLRDAYVGEGMEKTRSRNPRRRRRSNQCNKLNK